MDIKTVELEFKKDAEGLGIIDITRPVEHSVVDSKMQNGIVTVHSIDPNVCISTMEYEPGMKKDMTEAFDRLATPGKRKEHGTKEKQDTRPVLVGPSITIPFRDNRIMVGKWQQVVLMDFNGMQNRKKIIVQILGE